MRRFATRWQKRSVRASIKVEFLECRQLLSATPLPVNSAFGQYAVPLSVGHAVSAPAPNSTSSGNGSSISNQGTGSAVSGPYTPAQIRHAYGVDQLTSLDGTGQTIAIVDAYADPTIASDLATFDTYFGLPTANLVVATPQSSEGAMVANAGWDLEIALDVEWAHAIAPGAKILLVEAYSSSETDLLNAVSYAVSQGANQVSMSWGGGEYSGESSLNSYFTSPGVTYLASSGDTGGEMLFPAISPDVTSVGGTSISLDSSGNRISESTWSAGGGGQSVYNTEPSFQNGFQSTGYRTTPDVAYDADPNTGVYVYNNGQWGGVGGTSAGSPQWAGLIALANEGLANAKKSPLGTGQTFGTNSVLYKLAGGTSYTNPNGDFLDITTGSNTHQAGVGYDEATGLGIPVANQLIPDLIGPTTTTPTVGDSSFEQVSIGAANYVYNATGSAWTFNGSTGLASNNSGFTSNNPNAPQGTQVAFLQDQGSFTQSISGVTGGSYTISFYAAQRNFNGGNHQNFQILINGSSVGTFQPLNNSYQLLTSSPFTVASGTLTITFVGLNTAASGDNTALIDGVSVTLPGPSTPPSTPALGDSSFEQVSIGAANYVYNATGSAWTFNGSTGLASNNSGFTSNNPNAPQGTQVAFLQDQGSFTQSISGWTGGSYTISFYAAQRNFNGGNHQNFQILINGVSAGTFQPLSNSYQLLTSSPVTVASGTLTITFVGLNTAASGDNTALIDGVSVNAASQSTGPVLGDSGFEQESVGANNYIYNATGSAWTFNGNTGLSSNNSGFTSGDPNAPQGTQVAFLQDQGSFTQLVSGWTAGSYTLSFYAAQRYFFATNHQNFQIMIDGAVVGTFQPSGNSYQKYTTASFTVTAGPHTLSFVGLNTAASGDNTAFIDNVAIASA